MPLAKLKPSFPQSDSPVRAPALTADPERMSAVPSPARLLQQRLERSTGIAVAPGAGTWPLHQKAALIVTASMALWLALLTTATQAYHAVA